MNRTLKLFFLITLILGVIACASPIYRLNISRNYTFSETNKVGLIIGSITISQNNNLPGIDILNRPDAYIFINVTSGETDKSVITLSNKRPAHIPGTLLVSLMFIPLGAIGIADVQQKNQFTRQHGQVFAMELPPGKYQLKNWQINSKMIPANYTNNKTTDNHYPEFESKAGEIIYIGNINMNLKDSTKNFFGSFSFKNLTTEFSDKSKRDIPVLKDTFKKINFTHVKKQIITKHKSTAYNIK